MIYEYVCQECDAVYEEPYFARIGQPCIDDEGRTAECCYMPILRRVSMPQTAGAGVHNPYPYFNHNVGRVIESDRHYQQVLNEKAAKNEQITGTDHRYVPVYPGDLKDEGTMKKLGIGAGADRGESIEMTRRLNWRATPKSRRTTIDMKV